MNEFVVPKRCENCPQIARIQRETAEVKRQADKFKEATQDISAFAMEGDNESRAIEKFNNDGVEILTRTCDCGPVKLEGTSPGGRKLATWVCGSSMMPTSLGGTEEVYVERELTQEEKDRMEFSAKLFRKWARG